jgi:hypothetical protein
MGISTCLVKILLPDEVGESILLLLWGHGCVSEAKVVVGVCSEGASVDVLMVNLA